MLGAESYSLRLDREASGLYSDYLWLLDFDVFAGDLQIEGASVFFRVNHGNLIQFGAEKVPAPRTPPPDTLIRSDDARRAVEHYAAVSLQIATGISTPVP